MTINVKRRQTKTIMDNSGHIETNPDKSRHVAANKIFRQEKFLLFLTVVLKVLEVFKVFANL